MMITDFAASISRRAKDKQTGIGRFHIMKNRYGMDGLTYGANINIAIGSFQLVDENELEDTTPQESNTNGGFANNNFSMTEMSQLRNMLMNQ